MKHVKRNEQNKALDKKLGLGMKHVKRNEQTKH